MPRTVIALNGRGWRLGEAPDAAQPGQAAWDELERIAEWIPALVPGNVQADLVDAGRLPDPNLAFDRQAYRQAGEKTWWQVLDFAADFCTDDRVQVVLRGIDYTSDVFLNGHHLGRHEGMFSPQEYDVTSLVRSENRLAVRLLGARWLPRDRSTRWEKLLNRVEARWGGLPGIYPDRRDTLKCPMQFGWDFAPPLLTMGLWDDVYLAVSGQVCLRALRSAFVPEQRGSGARLDVSVSLDGRSPSSLRLVARLEGDPSEQPAESESGVSLAPGGEDVQLRIAVPRPRLWWPWDHGEQPLYRLTVELWEGDNLLDRLCQAIGLCHIEMDGCNLKVNGTAVYARGANWVPASLFPGRVTGQDYAKLLGLARQANMNTLRVWGGGLREKPAFYDECDRLGILVWQEFPFACSFVTRFPRSRTYLQLVRDEARSIVRDVRHHPCLAVWCGGNEFSPRRNAPLVKALHEIARTEDPGRAFRRASPDHGDHHNWLVWHNYRPPAEYLADDAAFASELGLQAPPATETLSSFLPRKQRWPPGGAWTARGAGLSKLWRYARPFLAAPLCGRARPAWNEVTPESFVYASQQAQLHGLKIAVEHFRRRKAAGCGGVLIWQLNEPWPAISWAVVPYAGEPKPAYRVLRGLFNPVLVSLAFPLRRYAGGDDFLAEAWVVNDTSQPLLGSELVAVLYDANGRRIDVVSHPLDVPASSASVAARLQWRLPRGERWVVTVSLLRSGKVLAANQYDLALHDGIRPTPEQRLWTWLSGLALRL